MEWLSNTPISPGLVRRIGEIDEFKGRWKENGTFSRARLAALRRLVIGEYADDRAEMVGLVFETFAESPLSEKKIRHLYAVLFDKAEEEDYQPGQYKTHPNPVLAYDREGCCIGVVFEPTAPADTRDRIDELIAWTNRSIAEARHHPLLIIAVFTVRFLSIQPFADGNGRLSRVLIMLLMVQAGYTYAPCSSLEKIIADDKEAYYRALRRAQATLDRDESGLTDWLTYFVQMMFRQQEALARKIAEEKQLTPLPPLSKNLLRIAVEHGRVTVRDAASLTEANRNTIKDHLKQLVETGHLVRYGQGRGCWYEKN